MIARKLMVFQVLMMASLPVAWSAPSSPVTPQGVAGPELPISTKSAGYSFEDCYLAALKRNEAVGIQTEALTQAEERQSQAQGSVLPTVTAFGSYTWQEAAAVGAGSSLFPNVQPLARINASQPLFRGLREFAGIRATRDQVRAQSEQRRFVATQLYVETAQAFYNVLSLEQELRNIDTQVRLYGKRVQELRDRRNIGRSRLSEELSTQSSMSALRAQGEALEGQLRSAREIFSSLTGLPKDIPLQDPQEARASEGSEPLSLDFYLKGLEERPDVRAETERYRFAEESVTIARGAHLPSADLNGNYYLARSGSLKDVSWDVQLSLSLPIYAGGVLQSRVREAASQLRQEELLLARVKRLAEQEVRTLHELVRADRRQIEALREAVDLAERNYASQSRDYRNGTVSNLEVLQALTAFQESRRALDRAKFVAKQNFLRLEAAAGRRPGKLLAAAGMASE